MGAAEKQRRYRDTDEQRRQQYLLKEREKWKKDVETGRKLLEGRKKWREAHKRSKARRKLAEGLMNPPVTPEHLFTPETPFRAEYPESSTSSQPGTSR